MALSIVAILIAKDISWTDPWINASSQHNFGPGAWHSLVIFF